MSEEQKYSKALAATNFVIARCNKVFSRKKLLLRALIISFIAGIVIAFSIPKYFSSSIKLATESAPASISGTLGSLASLAGFNIGGAVSSGSSLSPALYPEIISSTPFLLDLSSTPVTRQGTQKPVTLYEYMTNDMKGAWWGYLFALPSIIKNGIVGLFKGESEDSWDLIMKAEDGTSLEIGYKLANAMESILNSITLDTNVNTGVITLTASVQDPQVAADFVEAVHTLLQKYAADYRTDKARTDLEFTQKIYDDAKEDYISAQEAYARYADSNQNIYLQSHRAEQERLQNEMNVAFSVYSSLAQQLQAAKANVQENTPVFTVVQPAIVPVLSTSMSRSTILILTVVVVMFFCCAYILVEEDIKKFIGKLRVPSEDRQPAPSTEEEQS